MSYKITDLSTNIPDLNTGDTHFLILTNDLTLGVSLYGATLAWTGIQWKNNSTYPVGSYVNIYSHYIVVNIKDIDYLLFDCKVDYLLFTTVKADPDTSINGLKQPILDFLDYTSDPAIGNFNAFNGVGYNNMLGTYDIRDDYYFSDVSWNGVVRPNTVGTYSLDEAPQFDPSGAIGDIDNGPLFFPLERTDLFYVIKIAQAQTIIKKVEAMKGHRASLRALKWENTKHGDFSGAFFNSAGFFDISTASVDILGKNEWKGHAYLNINNWVDPRTDASFNLGQFIMNSYKKDLCITTNSQFSSKTMLYLTKSIRTLKNLKSFDCTPDLNHTLTREDFLDYIDDGYKKFQLVIYIVDENYGTDAQTVNPIEIALTFDLTDVL
jgi:hypothetical protein